MAVVPERNLSIKVEHLPGVDNIVADEESRVIQSTMERQLHRSIFQQNIGAPRQLQHRSVHNSPQCSIETVSELETRPRLSGSRCPIATVEQVGGICLPAFLPNWQGQRRQSIPDTSTPVWRSQPWYPALLKLLVDFPDTSTVTNAPVRPIWQTSTFNGDGTTTASRLETIRHRQQAEGISSEVL